MTDLCFDDNLDLVINDGIPSTSDSLKTAIYISLFTDSRCLESEIPILQYSPRGYWGDAIFDENTGSKLWLLERAKFNKDTLIKTKEYAMQSLKWVIDDGFAMEIEINTFYDQNNSLNIDIIIDKYEKITFGGFNAVY